MTLKVRAGLTLDEYLGLSLEQECELVAGELTPKPMGTFETPAFKCDWFCGCAKSFDRAEFALS